MHYFLTPERGAPRHRRNDPTNVLSSINLMLGLALVVVVGLFIVSDRASSTSTLIDHQTSRR
jgi:hypothetical protein